ncbi:GTP-binding protein [Thalassobacillus sp. C254]|uniref:GTP-binding protein n=1 Tax=Thalassobacillus sp. C254 TaxID=1225341 RepID=UPI0006D27D73|nr:GTP-binding protein [Thalassobacillus sp. C254]
MEQKKTPVYVLTGFLGSGKTTLLKEMLTAEKSAGRTPAVVLNELGEANVEKSYFNEETLIEKLNGCICCTIQTDLTDDLLDFFTYSKKKPDVMFIEGTGVADPLQVMDGLTDPRLQAFIDIKSVIGVVDAARYIEYQSMFSSSKEVREVLRSHLLHSSLLILNKVDECDVRTLEKVKKKIDKAKLLQFLL